MLIENYKVGDLARHGLDAATLRALNPRLAQDPRFATNAERIRHRSELNVLLEPAFASRSRQHWIDAFAAGGIPCGPVHDLPQVFADP